MQGLYLILQISASLRSEKEKASRKITAACNYKEQKECDDQSSQKNSDDKTEACMVQCPELRFYVKLPKPDDHKNHLMGEV